MPREEYAGHLYEAMQRMRKKMSRLMDEEDSLCMKADNQGLILRKDKYESEN